MNKATATLRAGPGNNAGFAPATRHQRKLRLALVGPSGSGKTYTALTIARELGDRVAVIDTERGSASVYADLFDFDTLQLTSYSPESYLHGIDLASAANYDVLIIDSLSHAWAGKDGILEFVDKVASRDSRGNTFGAWREATPAHNRLVEGILDAVPHVIVTMRAKVTYAVEKDERTGSNRVVKLGMQPVQREGLEYEMDIVGDMAQDLTLTITKTRCDALHDYVAQPPGADFAHIIKDWLGTGEPTPERPEATVEPQQLRDLAAAIRPLNAPRETGLAFIGWLAGVDNLTNARHLTRLQATVALSKVATPAATTDQYELFLDQLRDPFPDDFDEPEAPEEPEDRQPEVVDMRAAKPSGTVKEPLPPFEPDASKGKGKTKPTMEPLPIIDTLVDIDSLAEGNEE